jgi:hypothetical protein
MDLPSNEPMRNLSYENAAPSLRGLGLLDFLDNDPRPSFILDLSIISSSREHGVTPVYCNKATGAHDVVNLLDTLRAGFNSHGVGLSEQSPSSEFRTWVSSSYSTDIPFVQSNFSWTKVIIADRWSVISGASTNLSTASGNSKPETLGLSKRVSKSKLPTYDWTDEIAPAKISSHVAWARSIDWAATALGPMSSWSSQLRSIANLVMQDPRPAIVFYGADLIMIYNEAEIELLGGFHPCMGVSARVALAAIWEEYFEAIITANMAGETVEKTNHAIQMVRNGFMEETYFSLKFIPILDSEGATVGHYEPLIETVSHVSTTFLREH